MNDRPLLLVHGLASSFDHNWRRTGWVDIVGEEGREIIAVDLPGHGTNSAQDPARVSPAAAVLAAIGGQDQVDAVGFSAGGHALLAAAAAAPRRFGRIALLGVGDGDDSGVAPDRQAVRLAEGLESEAEPDDWLALVIRRAAASAGNDRHAVAAYLRAEHSAVSAAELASVDVPVLVVLGDRDFAGPASRLLSALPDARLVTLRGVDHFGTLSDYGCIEAVTRFLSG
jgi:pimeloyl-ACP methyl ester carboxylesterase